MELIQNHHKPGMIRSKQAEVTGGITLHRLAVNGTLLSETQDGSGYRHENTQLIIEPDAPVRPGDTAKIEVEWTLPIPKSGAGERMGYSNGNLFFLAYWYPQMAVYDDVTGWMTDPFLGEAQFYAGFADYSLALTVPEEWVVHATGHLQNPDAVLSNETQARRRQAYASDEPLEVLAPDQRGTVDVPDDSLTWRFTADRVRDLVFSLSRNAHWEAARTPVGDRDGDGTVDSTRINTVWRDSAPKWSEVTRYQQHALTFLSQHTGFSYPWSHMTAVEGGMITGGGDGGMEFPMMTIMGHYNDRSQRALYAVTAHELAHIWIPMIANTNERRYAWIDEGTTAFNENMARRDFYEHSEAVSDDLGWYLETARNNREGEIRRWTTAHRTDIADYIASYQKPSVLYSVLRSLLGAEVFRKAYHEFFDTWAYKHPYPSDFFNTIERVSGRELDWFWYSWYDTTWTLDQAIESVRHQDGKAIITVRDRGNAPMPVRLSLSLANGDTVSRVLPVDVWLKGCRSATARVSVGGAHVERVEIDAKHAFPDLDRSNNIWRNAEN